jgi:O-antigen ligase
MAKFKNLTINTQYLNFLLCLIPIAYIFGNLAINALVVSICILGFLIYKKQLFFANKEAFLLPFLIFFLYIILITFFDSLRHSSDHFLDKSFLFLRFFLFFIVINCMVKKSDFNFKYFFLSCLFFSTFVAIDVIYQSITGIDFFGNTSGIYHNSGIFGAELIAGGYIQRFLLLGIFAIPLFLNKNQKMFIIIFSLILFIGICGIILSGNRIPMVMSIIFITLVIIFIKELRYINLVSLAGGILIISLAINLDSNYRQWMTSFYSNSKVIVKTVFDYEGQSKREIIWDGKKINAMHFGSGHLVTFITALDIWNDKPIIGHGLKSMKRKCGSKIALPNRVCNNHPHNYYLEILSDTGLLGLILIMGPIYYLLIQRLFLIKMLDYKERFVSYALFFALLMELFPLKSTGGFFSTSSAAYIFLLLGLFLNQGIKKPIRKN